MKPRRNKRLLAAVSGIIFSASATAGVGSDLEKFYNKLGFEANATGAAAWQGQAAGYATGGNLFLRNRVKQLQVASFTPPSLTAGCGGIDAYLGAFSYINSEQLEAFIKNLMANSAGYFFDLALQTVVPELKDVKDYLQQASSFVNNMNMNSCQAAQGIVGGLWPRTQESQKYICNSIGNESNLFSDWAAARQGCSTGGQLASTLGSAGEEYKDQVITNKNLMWEILKKNSLLSSDTELMELVMNLTGTLIYDAQGHPNVIYPSADNHDLVKALMSGGSVTIQRCTATGDCLSVREGAVTIAESNALRRKVEDSIISIQSKLTSDTALSDAEKGFIQSTSIPVLRYLVDPMQLNLSVTLMTSLSDYIAYDILVQYLRELVEQARAQMASKNYPEPQMEALTKSIDRTWAQIQNLQSQVQVKSDALAEVERQMAYLRQQTSSQMMERYQQNYNFGQ
ncbi:conjugal transfer pilus assembly protein TraH [Entomohabitans teleogrylli]|uniref:conjugal transfer pilus assembly protein TraH n=1 Tax=Entomohabitans teleogrylli TaxID=1384589 RepID=UPI00073D5263|nr:conjugal transfer pilus assembly protein TraH [Entomohabitans teleogrylli]